MRRIVLFIGVCVVSTLAFTNLTFTPDTIAMGGEKTLITGNFSAVGDSANILLFIDDNANNIYDEGAEILIYNSRDNNEFFIDGGDQDTVADGLLYLELASGWGDGGAMPFAGTYILVVDDNGGGDTASVVVTPIAPTNTSVSGTVTGPGMSIGNILVFVEVELGNDEYIESIERSAIDGSFTIYLPDSVQGKKCWIGAEDEFNMLQGLGLIPPAEVETTVVASITGLSFVFIEATQFIAGQVQDETGTAVGNVGLWFEDRENDIGFSVDVDSSGSFIAPVTEGTWELYFEDWSGDDAYMRPDVKVEVTASDDTVEIVYMVYTTDATISGTIIDSAGIDLNEDFGVNVSVDTTGQWQWDVGVWYYIDAEINDDATFSIPVNSKFLRYQLHTWADNLPDGYFVNPNNIDSVGPGQSDIVIKIQKAAQVLQITVRDMANDTTVPSLPVQIQEQTSSTGQESPTDTNGVVTFTVYPGDWRIWVGDAGYLKQDVHLEISDSLDTITTTYAVYAADAVISGTVTGEFAEFVGEVSVMTGGTDTTTNQTYYNEAYFDSTGAFSINVSTALMWYYVGINEWNLPDGYLVLPGGDYSDVAPNTADLLFQIMKATGSISGKFTMTVPVDALQVGVIVSDPSTNFLVIENMDTDTAYKIDVPNGVYTVVGGYITAVDSLLYIVDSVVISDNDVIINFTDSGAEIVPVIYTPVINNLVFNLRNYPNPFYGATTIKFSTPVDGKATLRIFDMNGRMLKILYAGVVSKGHYYIQFNTRNVPYSLGAGYYIARLTISGEKSYTKNIKLITLH